MASPAATVAASTAAAAAVAAPTELGVIAAVIGAALSVWAAAARTELSARAVLALLGTYLSSVAVGLAGSAAVQSIGPRYDLLAPLATLPDWVLSLALAGSAQTILPLLAAVARRKSDAA
jgi:hypothetical protein